MAITKELIRHILHHVNAEAADSDDSQAPGVAARAQYVRDAVRNLVTTTKDNTRDTILQTISNDALADAKQTSFRRAIANIRSAEETRPQLLIQEWVGKNLEEHGG